MRSLPAGLFGAIAAMVLSASANAQSPSPQAIPRAFENITRAVATELSGPRALSTVAFVEQFFRLPGNRGYDASIDTVASLLEAAGYVPAARATTADRLVYRVESRPMANLAWTPDSASLTIAGRAQPVLRFQTNRNMVAINSGPTPPGGVRAEVIDAGDGADSVFRRLDVQGRIVLTSGAARTVFPRAMQRGALGVLAVQRLPAYNKPDRNVDAIGFSSIPRDSLRNGWLLFLSPAARDSVRAALRATPKLHVHVMVATRFDQRPDRTIIAEVRGRDTPEERFVYSAHVQEPGANDNASGVGLLAEMARTTAVLVRDRKVDPARTLTFLWGDEIRSTQRFLSGDATRRAGVRWGMSLDMVGENTALTGGTFLIEKMPDPSAVWVRGEDQHSEWGGQPIDRSAIRPHWFNDFVRQRCLDRASTTGWVVKANPFEGGSDHTPFLDARIPAVLLWHFTDQFYHTDRDRIENVSDTTLANVGNCALTTGLLLATGGTTIATALLDETAALATRALETQAALSRDTLARGADRTVEQLILETWRDYYLGALSRASEVGPVDARRVTTLQRRLRHAVDSLLTTITR